MALAYLIEPAHQWQDRRGVNNVSGWIEVFISQTDDHATTYANFSGALNPERIGIDNNGRAVIIVDSSKVYRIEHYLPNGELMFTQDPVWPMAGGSGGVSGTRVISTDGSIQVDRSSAGGVTTYDIGLAPGDSDEFLEWIKCSEEDCGATWKPVWQAGTMETEAGQGIKVHAGHLYHFTNTFYVDPDGTGTNYDTFAVNMYCGGAVADSRQFDIDSSLDDSVMFEFSSDIIPEEDGCVYYTLTIPSTCEVTGEVQVHRIYSGVNAVPDSCATKQWVEEELAGKQDTISDLQTIREGAAAGATAVQPATLNDYATTSAMNTALSGKQNVLTAGTGIDITGDTISCTQTFTQVNSDWNAVSGVARILNKPDLSQYVTDSEMESILSGYATSSELTYGLAGKQDTISDLQTIREGAAAGATAVQPATLNDYATTSAMNTALSGKQNVLTAGTGIDITGDTISCTQTFTQVNSDWDATSGVAQILHKPDLSVYATTSAMNTALAGKQDVINDLSDIRSGAAAGATAVQPATLNDYATTSAMNTALAGKQDVISDLSDIRSGAALGATAVQPAALNDYVTTSALATTLSDYVTDTELGTILEGYATTTALSNGLAGKQDTISDLSDIRSGAALGATAVQPAALNDYATTSAMNTALAGKQDTLTAGTGITISGSTISNSAPNVKSDWNAAAGSDAEILNKPTIPVVPQMKELVAGTNISLAEGVTDVTVNCTLTVGTVTV